MNLHEKFRSEVIDFDIDELRIFLGPRHYGPDLPQGLGMFAFRSEALD